MSRLVYDDVGGHSRASRLRAVARTQTVPGDRLCRLRTLGGCCDRLQHQRDRLSGERPAGSHLVVSIDAPKHRARLNATQYQPVFESLDRTS